MTATPRRNTPTPTTVATSTTTVSTVRMRLSSLLGPGGSAHASVPRRSLGSARRGRPDGGRQARVHTHAAARAVHPARRRRRRWAAHLARRSALPDPVATHWSASGANGFTSVLGVALLTVVLSAGVGGAVAISAAFGTLPLRQRRVMLGVGIGVSVAIATAFVLLTLGQAGLADAHQAVLHPGALIAAGL